MESAAALTVADPVTGDVLLKVREQSFFSATPSSAEKELMWPKQKGLWVVCPLFPCHPVSGVMPVASAWFLLFYGHRALDQWPPWPSALIPYPVLITCS